MPRALATDPLGAPISEADRAMVRYALALTEDPHAVGEDDVEALREAGFTDSAILDVCQVTAYYNYVNRLADGLGVELEERWTADDLTVDRTAFERMVAARREAT